MKDVSEVFLLHSQRCGQSHISQCLCREVDVRGRIKSQFFSHFSNNFTCSLTNHNVSDAIDARSLLKANIAEPAVKLAMPGALIT